MAPKLSQEVVAKFQTLLKNVRPELFNAYRKRPNPQFQSTLPAGKFCQWLTMYGEENHQFILDVIRFKSIRVNEADWSTCASQDLPTLYAYESIPGYCTLHTKVAKCKDKTTGGLEIRNEGGKLTAYISVSVSKTWKTHQARLMGILKGLEWSFRYLEKANITEKRLIVRNDFKEIIDTLITLNTPEENLDKINNKHTQLIYRKISDVIKKFEDVKFVFVPSRMNQIADLLAGNYMKPKKKDGSIEYSKEFILDLDNIAEKARNGTFKCFPNDLPKGFVEKYDPSKFPTG
ncbi:tripartite motif-containing protein 16-like protein [Corchorus capsularis]|uniref:Tripartite motif-containing protein 16-like protein n=1 Tax=Corchorus capsularis TaxID=210143 RepID=A0A1R3IUX3_COCAP|nr:tripartite motif-containing protein 16-like protein [Corchorus capsularis]